MSDLLNNPILNAGMALGGGLGSMPVALPYSLGGVAPGVAFQGGDAGVAGVGAMGGAAAALPMGMINRDGQQFMGQQQPQQPEQGMSQGDMMKLASMAMQGMNRGQQGIQAPTQQIMRDQNRFSYTQSPQQQMAQALRNRG